MAIAEAALAAGHSVEFSGDVASPVGQELISALCSRVHPGPKSAEELAALAVSVGADLVHIDTYVEQGAIFECLNRSSVRFSSMEDGTYGRRRADIIIDPSPGAEVLHRPDDGSYRLFRGTKSIPIRRSIRQLRSVGKHSPAIKRVMIIMGGTDARDMTATLVKLWAKAAVPSHCVAVDPNGRSTLGIELLEGQTLELVRPSLDVPELFPTMDVVISGAGTTTWELATLGVPTGLVQLVGNQNDNYQFAIQRGIAVGLGDISTGELDEAAAIQKIQQLLLSDSLRRKLSTQSTELLDGAGADRIVTEWEQLMDEPSELSIRPATVEDAGILFDWRNEASVRAVSRQRGELHWGDHVAWVTRAVANPEVCLLIAQFEGARIGTVRFHVVEPNVWEASITLAPEMRGRGMASAVLAAAEVHFFVDHPEAILQAAMLESNVQSFKLFQGAGYVGELERIDGELWYRLTKTAASITPN
ncbi:GNAT family N-acetyltransferase [Pseudarthrobacter sp. J1763]|uniref:GNAT family N-acetyltransferase n=1 Tax=Pseudarthrobacter sp. J1763 TaxID=3420445 RepID=UPI003D2A00E6